MNIGLQFAMPACGELRFCPYCGAPLGDDFTFCGRCGKKLPDGQ